MKQEESKYRLRSSFFDTAEILFVLYNKNMVCIDANAAFLKTFGTERQNIIGKHVAEFIPDAGPSGRLKLFKKVLKSGKPLVIDETKSHPKLGNLYVRMKAFKVGQNLGIAIKNITDLKDINEKLARSEGEIRSFAKHLNQTIEAERSYIAREIHDEIGQQLAGMKIGLTRMIKPDNAENMRETIKEVDALIQSLRKIATQLRPGILDSLGLFSSLEWLLNEFERKTKIDCVYKAKGLGDPPENSISTNIFRICQESLTNISKHAQASKVSLEINKTGRKLVFKITDNGVGIKSDKLTNPFSMGLLGIRERANLIGGELIITSNPGAGTTIRLTVPI